MRFQEFLDKNPDIESHMKTDAEVEDQMMYSFRIDDSFENLSFA
jgi:hypothetical protein